MVEAALMLALALLAAAMVLLPFLLIAWIPHRVARGPAVKHITCAACRYNVEFAPSRHCQECGGDLTQVGVLHPGSRTGRPLRTKLYVTLFAAVALAPAIVLGVFIGELLGEAATSWKWRYEMRERHMPAVIATGPSSNGFLAIGAWLEFDELSRRDDDGRFEYHGREFHRLGLGVTSLNQTVLPHYIVTLENRLFRWVDGYVGDDNEPVPSGAILTERDVDRGAIMRWLRDGAINIDDDAVRADVDAFLDLIQESFPVQGRVDPNALDRYQNVAAHIGYEWPGMAAQRMGRYATMMLTWLLLMLVPLARIRRTAAERRRLAREWLDASSISAPARPAG